MDVIKCVVDEEMGAMLPERAHATDAGMDLFAPIDFVVPAHGYAFVDVGVSIELPSGTRGHVCSKSGLNRFHGLTADGTIDEGYTNTIGVTIHNSSSSPYHFKRGDKVAQVVIERVLYLKPVQVASISGGERGDDGFGSTGR